MSPSDDADTAKLEEEVDHDGAEKEEDGVTKDQEEESSSREDPSGKHLYLPVCYGKVNLEHAYMPLILIILLIKHIVLHLKAKIILKLLLDT